MFSLLLPGSSGFEENLEVQGELILQDSFQVWDPRSLIRKGRDRHLFLFEFSLVFSKEIKDSAGRTKYQYKSRLLVSGRRCGLEPPVNACGSAKLRLFLLPPQTSELGVTEHIEGDPCKFALWAGRTPSSDNKTVLKVRCEGGVVDQVAARWPPGGRQVAAVATATLQQKKQREKSCCHRLFGTLISVFSNHCAAHSQLARLSLGINVNTQVTF